MTSPITLRCVAGPDAGWSVQLAAGTHWVGRAGETLGVCDPAMEPHHAQLHIDELGRVHLLQTAGRHPVLVDGDAVAGWHHTPAGAGIEIGSTRIEVGPIDRPGLVTVDWVYAPHAPTDDEYARFARDVGHAADAARSRSLVRPPGHVEIGTGTVTTEIDVRDARCRPIDGGGLDHAGQSILERNARRSMPVFAPIAHDRPLALVGGHSDAIVDAITPQLAEADRAQLIVADVGDADAFSTSGRPVIVAAPDFESVPPWCRSVLEVGATWRGVWHADTIDHPESVVRLHVRGARRGGRQRVAVGRSSLNR